jgi:Phytanoyl-CoA dioxygenase (PhyH)
MNSMFFNMNVSDDLRRQRLYDGQLFAYSPTVSSLAFCDFAKEMVSQVFGSLHPETAQFSMPVEEYAAVLADLKPKFIHHPRSKECIQGILRDLKCDLNKTYFDVPRLRTSTSDNYLTSGIAYAFHMHRDTWYSAPFSQINWWIPVYDLAPENTMAFHPRYWSQPVRNGSRDYNYTEWNRENRKNAAKHIKSDTRKQPKAEEPIDPDPQIRFVAPAGSILMFSAAQMHSSVPNTSGRTRISIDFRTVHLDDVVAHRGAPNIDSECTGTTMRDYLRGTDLSHINEDICLEYDTQPSPA